MIWLTAIIAGATILNVVFFVLESNSSTKSVDRLSEKAEGIVGTMNKALSDNRDAIDKAFKENKDSLDAAAERDRKVLAAGERSLRIASEQMELSQRPWLQVAGRVSGPLYYNVNGANLQIAYIITNTGNTPAVHVRFEARFHMMSFTTSKQELPARTRDRLCESIVKRGPMYSETLTPHSQMDERVTTTISQDDLNKAKAKGPPLLIAHPMFCVAYESEFMPDQHYYTGIYFDLYTIGTNPQGEPYQRVPDLFADVPAEKLILKPGLLGPAIVTK